MNLTSNRTSPVRFPDSWASIYFDLLRGLAALFVLFGHWRNLFFVDYSNLTEHRQLLTLPYLLTGAGHQSVILFFVLSGYLVGGTVFRDLKGERWHWRGYLLRRIVRLWTVLIPALLLCLFWDKLGIHLGQAPALYNGLVPNHMIPDVPHLLTPRIFFGNLFFLQTILTPVLGSDGPLWSLANEFWYYILFPLGMVALWPRARASHRLICAILFLAAAWLVRDGILEGFPIWLLGALLYRLKPPSFAPQTGQVIRVIAPLLYLPVFFALSRLHSIPGLLADYFLAALTFALLWVLLSAKESYDRTTLKARGSRQLASFSYTLYAVHVPFLVFLVSLLVGETRWIPSTRTVAAGVGILLCTIIYAYALAFFTEFRTDPLRSRLERLFGIAPAPRTEAARPNAISQPL
jgi:peptidoglycan/LPS O-acetylase OafA/YrhL